MMTPRSHLPAFLSFALLIAFLCCGALPTTSHATTRSARAAGPGDTTIVQTFTFGSPLEGRFLFPDRTKRWEKVLMYYKLKCNPAQNPKCGEWDYLTYTYLFDHTGRLDSTKLFQANFLVNNAVIDTFRAMTTPSLRFVPRMEYHGRIDRVPSGATTGSGGASDAVTFSRPSGARAAWLWRANELRSVSIPAGTICGMALKAKNGSGTLRHLVIRMRVTDLTEVPDSVGVMKGWTTVFDRSKTNLTEGWVDLTFHVPFAWDGTSNILVDIAYDGCSAPLTIDADNLSWVGARAAVADDFFTHFRQRTEVTCGPVPEMNGATALTLETWMRPDAFTDWANLVIKSLNVNNRFGLQMGPRNDGNVDIYALVGVGSNIYGNTTTRPFHAGDWYHVAMVYDGTGADNAGRLKLYINGILQTLTFTGTIPAATSNNNEKFTIAGTGTNPFQGSVDEVRLWKRALTVDEIHARMFTNVTAGDPLFSSLVSGWSMDEGKNTRVSDIAGAHDGFAAPPQWQAHGAQRIRGFAPMSVRPVVMFMHSANVLTPDAQLAVDTIPQQPMMITVFGDTTRANISTDTLYRWPQYWTYTFDAAGTATDSALVTPDETFIRHDYPYYGPPFEVVNRYELGRYITPYGNGLDLGEGWTWVYDVTDFQQMLADSVHLSAGNWQEMLDMKFVFIEGTPPRDVKRLQNMWVGTWGLNVMAQKVLPKTMDLLTDTKAAKLRITSTGHDFSNATNCAEFCPKMHWVSVDGTQRSIWQIVQECAKNPLYPQGGTWIYDRAGWCPGMPATTKEVEITPYLSGSQVTLAYNCDYDEFGRYVVESQLVEYGAPNFTLDAAVDAIIQPSTHELNRRFNPICGRPHIVIKNTGSTPLTSLDIEYGPVGKPTSMYHWTGNIEFLMKEDVYLPAMPPTIWDGADKFAVRISNPNGGADQYSYNNRMESSYKTVPVYTSQVFVYFRPNNAATENRYEVMDANGAVVHSRSGFQNATLVRDTLNLAPGCYEFVMYDTDNDGISFWANNDGTGNLSLRFVGGGTFVSIPGDFGAETRLSFIIAPVNAAEELPVPKREMAVYPNPASGRLNVEFALDRASHVRVDVHDVTGRIVRQIAVQEYGPGTHTVSFDANTLESGVYLVRLYEGLTLLQTASVRIVR